MQNTQAGLHEVARELENPFRNAPNDVPLCTLLAFYNEALITTFAGFHPDAYWDQADVLKKKKNDVASASTNGDEKTAEESTGVEIPPLIPDLPEAKGNDALGLGSRPRPSTAIPQSTVDGTDSLKELREMIDSQASEIKKLQDRVQKKGRPSSAPTL